MKTIYLNRGQGKTTRLLYASEFQNIPILCSTYAHKKYLIDMANKLELKIPEPIAVDEITSSKIKGSETADKDLLVDEANWVLQYLLNRFGMKGKIRAITLTKGEK